MFDLTGAYLQMPSDPVEAGDFKGRTSKTTGKTSLAGHGEVEHERL